MNDATTPVPVRAWKGFNPDLTCRGEQIKADVYYTLRSGVAVTL